MEELKNTPFSTNFKHLADLKDHIDKELGLTDWVTITQENINQFGKLTLDEQWIHTDVEKANKHSPFGVPIAHGFMVLSYASRFAYDTYSMADVTMGLNYGLDKVRFPTPTPVGSAFRGRVSLMNYTEIDGGARYTIKIVFELKGADKPCCVAEFIAMAFAG
jgi:acyl dehydratase